MADPVDVSISVVNTNNRALVERCLRSMPDACADLTWRAAVVDNASDDGSEAMIRCAFPWARVIRNERRLGFSTNHNQILRREIAARTARYALILNEDTVLDSRAVTELVSFSDTHPSTGALGPTIRGSNGDLQPSYFRYPTVSSEIRSTLRRHGQRRAPSTEGWLNGSCLLFRIEALRQVGTLDERFFIFYEDTDICLRLQRDGWDVAVAPAARLLHHGHQTVSQPTVSAAMEHQMVRSRYLYFAKHHGPGAARAVDIGGRAAFALRAGGARVRALFRRDKATSAKARLLTDLARYRPIEPLPHEVTAITTTDNDGESN